jgi:hydrogenase expression/formation protein HypC
MCLAVPVQIISIDEDNPMRMGKAKVGQVEMDVCMEFLPEANVGDYVLVHVGTALTLINEEDALATLKALEEMGELDEQMIV